MSQTSSPCFPFLRLARLLCFLRCLSLSLSLSFPSHSLHSSTWNKCMLVLVAPVAMLVSTGLRGLADLWCSTTRERLAVSAGTCYCFLYSIQASPRGSLFPRVTLPWSTIDYVSDFICMNDLCLSFALHSSDEEMLIQFCPKAMMVFFYMYDESWEMHYKRNSHFDRWKGEFSYHTSSLGLIIKHLCYESKIKRSWAGGGFFFFFLTSLWCVCLSVCTWWKSAERHGPSPQPIFLSTDIEGLQNKG